MDVACYLFEFFVWLFELFSGWTISFFLFRIVFVSYRYSLNIILFNDTRIMLIIAYHNLYSRYFINYPIVFCNSNVCVSTILFLSRYTFSKLMTIELVGGIENTELSSENPLLYRKCDYILRGCLVCLFDDYFLILIIQFANRTEQFTKLNLEYTDVDIC